MPDEPTTPRQPRIPRRTLLVGAGAIGAAAVLTPSGGRLAAAQAMPEISNVFVETRVRAQQLRVTVDVPGTLVPGAELVLQVAKLDGDTGGLPGARAPVEATDDGEVRRQVVTMPWADPRLWNLEDAYLYRLSVELVDPDGTPLAAYEPVRFGFREIWTEGKDLILNGAPIRLRLAPFVGAPEGRGTDWATGVPQMRFFSGMGMNAIEFQPNSSHWNDGCAEGVMQAGSEEILDLADERGWAVLMPTQSINPIRNQLGDGDEDTIAQYVQDFWHCARELDRQNRPCIIAWAPSMNLGHHGGPEELGRYPEDPQPAWFQASEDLIKSQDPTRLVYHHQGGQNGDIEMPNFFLNFAPLQEREEWLSAWSQDGEKPWGAVEHGPPSTGNFFRGRFGEQRDAIPYFTEYITMYLGDAAYARESDEFTQAVADAAEEQLGGGGSRGARPWGGAFQARGHLERVGGWTAFYDFMDLFIRNTNKAYRGWGVNGGLLPWIQDVGFGIPPDHEHIEHRWLDFHYAELWNLDDALEDRPDWANPIYDAFHDTLQPLLVFIGGPEKRFTAKDHNYVAGEQVEKTLVAVWDGPGSKELTAGWRLVHGDEVLSSGEEEFDLAQGAVERRPIHFSLPSVSTRTSLGLELTVEEHP